MMPAQGTDLSEYIRYCRKTRVYLVNIRAWMPLKANEAPEEEKGAITEIQSGAQKGALSTVAYFPVLMLLCYIGLILYFRSKGGI